jgi:hypothetical protein
MMDEMQAVISDLRGHLKEATPVCPARLRPKPYQTTLYNNMVQLGLQSAPQYAALENQMVTNMPRSLVQPTPLWETG